MQSNEEESPLVSTPRAGTNRKLRNVWEFLQAVRQSRDRSSSTIEITLLRYTVHRWSQLPSGPIVSSRYRAWKISRALSNANSRHTCKFRLSHSQIRSEPLNLSAIVTCCFKNTRRYVSIKIVELINTLSNFPQYWNSVYLQKRFSMKEDSNLL